MYINFSQEVTNDLKMIIFLHSKFGAHKKQGSVQSCIRYVMSKVIYGIMNCQSEERKVIETLGLVPHCDQSKINQLRKEVLEEPAKRKSIEQTIGDLLGDGQFIELNFPKKLSDEQIEKAKEILKIISPDRWQFALDLLSNRFIENEIGRTEPMRDPLDYLSKVCDSISYVMEGKNNE